jgi:uncharacterized protein
MSLSSIPFPRAILNQHSATLGKTGAGKSSALRVSIERLLDENKRVTIIDPKGDWWGLKASADGKGPGYPVILFGNFKNEKATDVPINEASGRHVAELIASGNRPCVIGFRGWMPSQMMNFWVGQPGLNNGFAPTLFNANQGELYLIIDEVQNFAPKGKIISPQAGLCLHWTIKLSGESRGLGITLHIASQRSQKVHNDVLDGCETLFAMRVTHTAARDSVKEWINSKGDAAFGKEVLSTLAELKRGEAWVWSPENEFGPERVQFPMFKTFDSFAPPQLQKKNVSQAGWSDVDLDEIRAKLSTVIAEAEASDPRKLRERIAKLEQELRQAAAAQKPAAPQPKIDPEREKKIAERAAKAATAPLLKHLHKFQRAASIFAAHAKKSGEIIATACEELTLIAQTELPPEAPLEVLPAPSLPAAGVSPARLAPAPPAPRPTPMPANGNGDGEDDATLSGPQLQMLRQLATFRAIGKAEVNLAWLAAALRTTMRARGFEANLAKVKRIGCVIVSNGQAQLTTSGLFAAGEVNRFVDVKAKIAEMLSGPQAQLFRLLDQVYPNAYSLEDLAAHMQTTPRARGFEANMGFLKANELVTVSGGMAKRAEWIS